MSDERPAPAFPTTARAEIARSPAHGVVRFMHGCWWVYDHVTYADPLAAGGVRITETLEARLPPLSMEAQSGEELRPWLDIVSPHLEALTALAGLMGLPEMLWRQMQDRMKEPERRRSSAPSYARLRSAVLNTSGDRCWCAVVRDAQRASGHSDECAELRSILDEGLVDGSGNAPVSGSGP